MLTGFATSLAMDLFGLHGWTKNAVINFQNERFLLYFMIFLVGSLFHHQQAFASPARGIAGYVVVNCTAWIPIMGYLFLFILPFVAPGKHVVSPVGDRVLLWFSFYLSLFTLLYLAIETFRRYVDRTGHVWRELDRNSYYVYIIHVIVMGVIAWSLLGFALPAHVKYPLVTIATWIMCNLIISGWRALTTPQTTVAGALTGAPRAAH